MSRLEDVNHFYELLDELKGRLGETRLLRECNGRMSWPRRGVYFFFEPNELRKDSETPRVVRVGTHALKRGSKTTLWKRLRQHRGNIRGARPGGGNHRGSIFRLHVGSAILRREGLERKYPTWGVGSSADGRVRQHEYPVEKMVSQHIRSMPFLWLKVDDEPGPESIRGYIERNSVALLSNYGKLGTPRAIDPPSNSWLGSYTWNEKIRESGLWNANHVELTYKPRFLRILEQLVNEM